MAGSARFGSVCDWSASGSTSTPSGPVAMPQDRSPSPWSQSCSWGCGQAAGRMRPTGRPACSSACSCACSLALWQTATQPLAADPGLRPGSSAKCSSAGSSSRCSSSRPSSAARRRAGAILGQLTRCQDSWSGGITSTHSASCGSSASGDRPWRVSFSPSGDWAQRQAVPGSEPVEAFSTGVSSSTSDSGEGMEGGGHSARPAADHSRTGI